MVEDWLMGVIGCISGDTFCKELNDGDGFHSFVFFLCSLSFSEYISSSLLAKISI